VWVAAALRQLPEFSLARAATGFVEEDLEGAPRRIWERGAEEDEGGLCVEEDLGGAPRRIRRGGGRFPFLAEDRAGRRASQEAGRKSGWGECRTKTMSPI